MGQRTFKPRHATGSVGRKFDGKRDFHNMYDGDWERYRAKFLGINRRCYACGGIATVVDHVRPHQGDEKLFKQRDNHIPLCASDHNYITAKFDRNFPVGGSIDPKLRWLSTCRLRRGLTFKVKVMPSYP